MADETDSKRDLTAGVDLSEFDADPLIAGVVGADKVLLVRGAGGLFAIGATCTHSGAPLAQGLVVGDIVRCPWHHACFDAPSGAAVAAPALKALRRWTVEQREGRVFVGAPLPPSAPVHWKTEERIVIVGAGAAGVAAADALASLGAGAATTLIGNEDEAPYDRTALSKHFLAGNLPADKLPLELASLSERGVTLLRGRSVEAIEPEARLVRLSDGTALPFTKLILATGAEPRPLTVPGARGPQVHLLRSVEDAMRIIAGLTGPRRAVVIGGSFIAFEGAAALRDRGVDVTVASSDPQPFRKVLGPDIAEAILAVHRKRGTQLLLGAEVERITRDAVVLKDGTTLPADLVLVGIGVTPSVSLAERAGLLVDDGVVVDERLRTNHRDIFAAGDIARWPDPHSGRSIRVEHWAVAQRQGQVAALNALGGNQRYDVVPFFWTLHFDYSVRSLGHAGADAETLVEGDPAAKDALVRFREAGRDTAVATVERDRASLEAELAMERRLGMQAAQLPPPAG